MRTAASRLHAVLAGLVVLAVVVQVYLAGSYIFGAGDDALDPHRTIGFITHGIEVLVLVAALVAWLPRRELLMSLALAVVGTIQVSLASADKWAGGLHPLLALAVLGLAGHLAVSGRGRFMARA